MKDESPSHDEAEWNLQNLNHLATCTDSSYKSNQKSENLLDLIQSINPGHRYITKMLLAFGLLKDTSIIQTDKDNHHVSLGDIFNSNMFHTLQEEDAPIEDANEELIENNDHSLQFNQKIQRKVVADVANEILIRKITSGRLFTMGRGRMSLQGILKEVYLEIDDLCRTPSCNVDDEDDMSIRVLAVDMKYESDDWTDYSSEVPALVLDIERLIFKDLINEVITSEVSGP